MFLSWVFYLAVFLRNSYVFLRDVNWRGGDAGAALCVEDVAVLRDEKGISSAA